MILLLIAILCMIHGCSSVEQKHSVSSDAGFDAADASSEEDSGSEEKEVCNAPTCETLNCGIKTDKCGNKIDCGNCPSPYKCGLQDLQDYKPRENFCGLDCKLININSVHCHNPFVAEFECPNNKYMVELMASDNFDYTCTLIPYGTTFTKLHFCCGL